MYCAVRTVVAAPGGKPCFWGSAAGGRGPRCICRFAWVRMSHVQSSSELFFWWVHPVTAFGHHGTWLPGDAPSGTWAGRTSAGCLMREKLSDSMVSSLSAKWGSVTHSSGLRRLCNRRGGMGAPWRKAPFSACAVMVYHWLQNHLGKKKWGSLPFTLRTSLQGLFLRVPAFSLPWLSPAPSSSLPPLLFRSGHSPETPPALPNPHPMASMVIKIHKSGSVALPSLLRAPTLTSVCPTGPQGSLGLLRDVPGKGVHFDASPCACALPLTVPRLQLPVSDAGGTCPLACVPTVISFAHTLVHAHPDQYFKMLSVTCVWL